MAHAYRLPHSEFLGWSQDDRDKAIHAFLRERSACPGCGTREDEWDPQHGGAIDAYHATKHLCPGCRQLEELREDIREREEDTPGLHVVLKRRPGGKQEP